MTTAADELRLESAARPAAASVAVPAAGSVFAPNRAAPAGVLPVQAAPDSGIVEGGTAYVMPSPARRVGGPASEDDWDIDGMPPPPDNFPAGWDTEWQPSFENAELAARPEPKPDDRPVAWPAMPEQYPVVSERPVVSKPAAPRAEPAAPAPLPVKPELPIKQVPPALPSLYVPLARAEKDPDHPPQQITIMLRSMGEKERDHLRIKTLYGTLISFHGTDRFSFQIYESGRGHLIDFPNDTTRVCPELLARLRKLVGEDSWRVEDITFQ